MSTKLQQTSVAISNEVPIAENITELKNGENAVHQVHSENSFEDENNTAIQKYEEEWYRLFDSSNIGNLKHLAQSGSLRASRFRSVCWRVLLEVLTEQSSEWITQIRNTRCHYQKLKAQMTSDPRKNRQVEDNPLSQNTQSIWYQHFCDEELRSVIRQDVVRTFPGIDFFRKPFIQEVMVDILFTYARVQPLMCYRQGMHEILAPLLFVLHCDHQAMLHTIEQGSVSEFIKELLNPDWLEEDGYTLFAKIMGGIEFCYNIKDLEPTKTGYFPINTTGSPSNISSISQPENEVVSRLCYIKDNLLRPTDPDLCDHLQTLDIPLPVFGIRWLRLLFGREFPLQDLLVLWDAIFSEGRYFDFVNYIVVSMLIAIRTQLLSSDYTHCLTHLMRYPGVVDIMYIIDYALYLREPQERSPPSQVPNQIHNRDIEQVIMNAENKIHQANRVQKKIVKQRIKKLDNGGLGFSAVSRSEPEAAIIDGFTLHDPEVLRVELNHAHNVMAVCQLKLAQYHKILQRAIPDSNHLHETQQVLDGICELCHLLRSRHYTHHNTPEVEPALEAGESKTSSPLPTTVVAPLTPQHLTLSLKNSTMKQNYKVEQTVVPVKQDEPMKVFSQIVGVDGSIIPGAPLADPFTNVRDVVDFGALSLKALAEAVQTLNLEVSSK